MIQNFLFLEKKKKIIFKFQKQVHNLIAGDNLRKIIVLVEQFYWPLVSLENDDHILDNFQVSSIGLTPIVKMSLKHENLIQDLMQVLIKDLIQDAIVFLE